MERSDESSEFRISVAKALCIGVCALLPPPLSHATSVTPVQFAVTEGGGASLSIPIQIPRGIGGMEPQLSLSYSSGAGNGLLGIGWTLQGPSSISRCPQNKALDGQRTAVTFGPPDRYCLDGQRLVLVDPQNPNSTPPSASLYGSDGSEYKTDRDGLSRIRAVGNYLGNYTPRGFKVETKSGLTLEFGNVQDTSTHSSQVLTKPSSVLTSAVPTIKLWMLRRISDRLGSFVEFEYCKGEVGPIGPAPFNASLASICSSAWAGSAPVHYIRYTNRDNSLNGVNGVLFRYDARPDVLQVFAAGSTSQQSQRLSGIQTYVNFSGPTSPGKLVRSYDIHYDPIESGSTSVRATNASRILRIQERGEDGTSLLPSVSFTMSPDSVLGMNVAHQPAANTGPPRLPRCGGDLVGRLSQMCP